MGIMCNVKKVVNGKSIWGAIPIAVVIGLAIKYGGTERQVETNVRDIVEIKEDTKEIPKLKANQTFMMREQQIIKEDVKDVLRAVQ